MLKCERKLKNWNENLNENEKGGRLEGKGADC
jgi:hypothetical protein